MTMTMRIFSQWKRNAMGGCEIRNFYANNFTKRKLVSDKYWRNVVLQGNLKMIYEITLYNFNSRALRFCSVNLLKNT